jgi:uncharacterized protein (TIGR02145 family)
MEQGFIDILKQLVSEQGKVALVDTKKCKAFLADYVKSEYKKESRLLLQAVEAGVAKAIDGADDLVACKKAQIRELEEEHSLSSVFAENIVNALALVLRGDATVTTLRTAEKNIPTDSKVSEIAAPKIITQAVAKNTFTDARDGRVYKIVKIGNQVWMAENLNYDAPGSKFYDNDPKNGEKYGKLYDWETAKKACPQGWHLPSRDEWDALSGFVGGEDVAGKHLKAKSGWNDNGNGMDTYGFAALTGGNGDSGGSCFYGIGDYGAWWSASESNSYHAYYRSMDYDSADWDDGDKSSLFSVRCVKD